MHNITRDFTSKMLQLGITEYKNLAHIFTLTSTFGLNIDIAKDVKLRGGYVPCA